MEKPTELNNHEISNVSGALWANALGAIAGGIGGFYGAIIGGGRNASFSTIAPGTLAGMGAGALSPVKGFSSLATSVGGGLVSGAIANLASDLEGLETTDE